MVHVRQDTMAILDVLAVYSLTGSPLRITIAAVASRHDRAVGKENPR
jgi:hypothetical protein